MGRAIREDRDEWYGGVARRHIRTIRRDLTEWSSSRQATSAASARRELWVSWQGRPDAVPVPLPYPTPR